ncbi:serine hydrolase [Streptomycetaceae bacterium NBC_01309]
MSNAEGTAQHSTAGTAPHASGASNSAATTTSRRSVLGLLTAASAATVLAVPALAADEATAGSGPIPDDLRPGGSVDRYIAQRAAAGEFSGTVLLAHRGRPVLSRSHGMADHQRGIPNGPDTIFALASLNKAVTGTAVVQLAQQGRIGLHEKAGKYLDGLPADLAARATVHDLLIHRSGLGDYVRTEAYLRDLTRWATADEVMAGIGAIIRSMPLASVPGSNTAYSNSGYHLLGEIVARVSGVSYHDYIRTHIFAAAGMRTADFATRPQWRDDVRIARPYAVPPGGQPVDIVGDKIFIGVPGYNAFASAPDLVRFARALVGARLLSRTYTALALGGKTASMWSDSREVPALPAFGGYGPNTAIVGGHRIVLHNGGAPGQSTFLEIYPDLDLVTVVLSNHDGPAVSPIVNAARTVVTARPPSR